MLWSMPGMGRGLICGRLVDALSSGDLKVANRMIV
jgi:hypothetical protein